MTKKIEDILSEIMAMKSITMDTDGTEPPRRDVSPIHSVGGLLEGEFSIQLATMRTAIIIYMNDEQQSSEELIPSSQLVPILMKCRTRRSLAAALVEELVDLDT
ncbi:uncharacterized protein [Dysidea avara]|uniref:uncharacterized protein isoform X1 n=1 Tax=Dysidea avara TaxID=196820 RepID=UPI003321C196